MHRWVGTCCSVGANLALGPEAPMVHLGACAAHVATHAACGKPFFWQSISAHNALRSHRRQKKSEWRLFVTQFFMLDALT